MGRQLPRRGAPPAPRVVHQRADGSWPPVEADGPVTWVPKPEAPSSPPELQAVDGWPAARRREWARLTLQLEASGVAGPEAELEAARRLSAGEASA